MAPWQHVRTDPATGRIFERPLGLTEIAFYWDGVVNGTADNLRIAELTGDRAALCTPARVERAWARTMQTHPLLGAAVREAADGAGAHFVVAEGRLRAAARGDVAFASAGSAAAADAFAAGLLHGARPLGAGRLARVYVVLRTDAADAFHVVLFAAHCIADGVGAAAVLRGFLDLLAAPERAWTAPDVAERLAVVRATDDLVPPPAVPLSAARRRWRRAAAEVILARRTDQFKGGHTLPRTFTTATPHTPALSRRVARTIPPARAARILAACRAHRITLGAAHPVLAQAALARVLLRRRARGAIPDAEWAFRRAAPTHAAGPLNLRPFLAPAWRAAGGDGAALVAISFFFQTLPFLPLPPGGARAPGFDAVLPRARFFLRCARAARHVAQQLRHPLFFELLAARAPHRAAFMRAAAQRWRAAGAPPAAVPVPVEAQGAAGGVLACGGSSFGNADALLPAAYPLGGAPALRLRASATHLHCRPAELYLGAETAQAALHWFVFFDGNVYEEELVQEFLDEVVAAVEWYLGQDADEAGAKL